MPDKPPQLDLLQLGEMLQEMVQHVEIEDIIDAVALTIRATAESEPNTEKRRRLVWYTKQFIRLRAGPPHHLPNTGLLVGREALAKALHRLMLRVNRMRDLRSLPLDEREWVESLGVGLNKLWQSLEGE